MEYNFSKRVYFLIGFVIVLLIVFALYFFGPSVFAGQAINVRSAAEGQPLKGTFIISPSDVVGNFPSASDVKVTVKSSSGTFSKSSSLYAFTSNGYNNQYSEQGDFSPTLEVTVGFSGASSTIPVPDQVFSIRKDINSPLSFDVPTGYTPVIKKVVLRGQTIPNYQASITGNVQDGYQLVANYIEQLLVFKQDAPAFTVSLDSFGLTMPSEGIVTVDLTWQEEVIYSESVEVMAGQYNPQQPIIPFTPETDPQVGGQFVSCNNYVCETFGDCSVSSFEEISKGNYFSLTSQKALCHYTDCGRTFTFSKSCDLFEQANVAIVGVSPDSVDSQIVLTKFGTKDKFSANTKVASVIDKDLDMPVANLIYDNAPEAPYLDVAFVQSSPELTSHCYNGLLDVDEEKTDCGGECNACVSESPSLPLIFIWVAVCVSLAVAIISYRRSLNF